MGQSEYEGDNADKDHQTESKSKSTVFMCLIFIFPFLVHFVFLFPVFFNNCQVGDSSPPVSLNLCRSDDDRPFLVPDSLYYLQYIK